MNKVLLAAILCGIGTGAGAQVNLSAEWRVDVNARDWFTTSAVQFDTVRSAAYNPATDHITVVSRSTVAYPENSFVALNAATGADVSTNSLAAATGGTFPVMKHDHDDAGVAYIGNLQRNWSAENFTLYRLAGENDSLTTAYGGMSSAAGVGFDSARLGDTLQVVGSGTNTEIWCGTRVAAGPHLVKFTTANGTDFAPTAFVTIAGTWTSAPTYRGLSVKGTGPNATIWVTDSPHQAYKVNAVTGAVETTVTAAVLPAVIESTSIGYFEAHGLQFIGLGPGAIANNSLDTNRPGYVVRVNAPHENALVAQTPSLRTGYSINGNATGSVVFDPVRGNVIFLVTNNSLSAYHVPASVTAAQDWSLLQ